MAISSKKRFRGNEILSATLIELLLLIAFVLLLIIFIDNNQESDPIEKKRVCEGLLASLEPLVGKAALAGIDCEEYEKHSVDLLKRISEAATRIDQNQTKLWKAVYGVANYPPIGTPEAEFALDAILSTKGVEEDTIQREIAEFIAKNAQLEQKMVDLSQALAKLKEGTAGLVIDKTVLENDLKSTQSDLEKSLLELKAAIAEIGRPSGAGEGSGMNSGIGPCLTSNPHASRPSHDFIVEIDLRGPGYTVSLRTDAKHSKEISTLLDSNLIPKELGMDGVLSYTTTQEFLSAFSKLKAHAEAQIPKCGYQARVFLLDEMDKSTWSKLEDGVRETFLSIEKVINP